MSWIPHPLLPSKDWGKEHAECFQCAVTMETPSPASQGCSGFGGDTEPGEGKQNRGICFPRVSLHISALRNGKGSPGRVGQHQRSLQGHPRGEQGERGQSRELQTDKGSEGNSL